VRKTYRRLAIRPVNPLWYLAAFVLAIVGWMVGAVVAAGAWDSVRDAGITSANQPVDAGNRSVAVFTDVVQPDRRVTCQTSTEAERKAKKEPKPIPPASIELVVDDDGNQWHLIGFEPDGRNDMSIRCTPADRRSDNATYAYSVVDGFITRANTGRGIGYVATGAAGVLVIWTFIARRRNRNQETDDAST
jgi:hypothetical protein